MVRFPTISTFLLSHLSRKTTSGRFIREIDGLRFISIAMVIMTHLRYFLDKESQAPYAGTLRTNWLAEAANRGYYGVELFFVISGFILALPFAVYHLKRSRPVSLKQYFLRRVTRLEPPYILVITLFFVLRVLISDEGGVTELLPHYFASLFYLHNLIYMRHSDILSVAWSLEIEVQFYLLAPILALLFSIPKRALRRGVIGGIAVLSILLQGFFIPRTSPLYLTLANYIQFFLMGFILADVYLVDWKEHPVFHWKWDFLPPVILSVILLGWIPRPYWSLAFPFLILLFFYAAFRSVAVRSIIINPWITTIGGMCYTIYLIHAPLITYIGKGVRRIGFNGHFSIDFLILSLGAVPIVLALSFGFFALVERPCMEKDWPYRLYGKVRATGSTPAKEPLTGRTLKMENQV